MLHPDRPRRPALRTVGDEAVLHRLGPQPGPAHLSPVPDRQAVEQNTADAFARGHNGSPPRHNRGRASTFTDATSRNRGALFPVMPTPYAGNPPFAYPPLTCEDSRGNLSCQNPTQLLRAKRRVYQSLSWRGSRRHIWLSQPTQ